PGSVVPFFQSLGLSFGRDQNAFTSLDQTVYQLALPDIKPETIDKSMLFLSDVAARLTLPGKEIDNERQIVLEERRARAGVQQRISDYIYERLAPESTLGRRLPIGTEANIQSARGPPPRQVRCTAVGARAPAVVAESIKKHFGAAPAVPRPAPLDPGIKATSGTRAIVATDAELTRAGVSMIRVEPPRGPTLTLA